MKCNHSPRRFRIYLANWIEVYYRMGYDYVRKTGGLLCIDLATGYHDKKLFDGITL